ncbi:hypothetical protein CCH79_00003482, partial [Gambusia affinis]
MTSSTFHTRLEEVLAALCASRHPSPSWPRNSFVHRLFGVHGYVTSSAVPHTQNTIWYNPVMQSVTSYTDASPGNAGLAPPIQMIRHQHLKGQNNDFATQATDTLDTASNAQNDQIQSCQTEQKPKETRRRSHWPTGTSSLPSNETVYNSKTEAANLLRRNVCFHFLATAFLTSGTFLSLRRNIAMLKVHPLTANQQNLVIQNNPVTYTDHGQRHDIMLLKLQKPVTDVPPARLPNCANRLKELDIRFSVSTPPVLLPLLQQNQNLFSSGVLDVKDSVTEDRRGDTVQLAGEGQMRTGPNNRRLTYSPISLRLQCVDMKVVAVSQLMQTLGHTFHTAAPNKDVCHGDSGAAVVFNDMIYGLISGCGKDAFQIPAIHTDVCEYMDWICISIGRDISGGEPEGKLVVVPGNREGPSLKCQDEAAELRDVNVHVSEGHLFTEGQQQGDKNLCIWALDPALISFTAALLSLWALRLMPRERISCSTFSNAGASSKKWVRVPTCLAATVTWVGGGAVDPLAEEAAARADVFILALKVSRRCVLTCSLRTKGLGERRRDGSSRPVFARLLLDELSGISGRVWCHLRLGRRKSGGRGCRGGGPRRAGGSLAGVEEVGVTSSASGYNAVLLIRTRWCPAAMKRFCHDRA